LDILKDIETLQMKINIMSAQTEIS